MCSNMFKLVQDLFKCVQTCLNVKVKSENKNASTHFREVQSENKMLLLLFENWKVKSKCFEIEIQKWKFSRILNNSRETRFLPLLPPLFRKCKTGRNEYSFLTDAEEGDGQAVSRKDKILIRHAVTHFLSSWLQSKDDWISEDLSLPPGWKFRNVEEVEKMWPLKGDKKASRGMLNNRI